MDKWQWAVCFLQHKYNPLNHITGTNSKGRRRRGGDEMEEEEMEEEEEEEEEEWYEQHCVVSSPKGNTMQLVLRATGL